MDFVTDARSSARSVLASPRYALLTVTCLGLALAGAATMFAAADALFLRPPAGTHDPARLTRVYFDHTVPERGIITTDLTSYVVFRELETDLKDFDGLAAYDATRVSEGRGANASALRAALVSRSYFDVLGVAATQGRVFHRMESDSTAPVAVIADQLARSRFSSASAALGQSLDIGGRTYTIVGVAPHEFTGIDLEPVDLWLPLDVAANDLIMPGYTTRAGAYALSLVGRLGHATSRAAASTEITSAYRGFARTVGLDTTARAVATPVLRDLGPKPSEQARITLWLAGVAFAVLIIGVINAANLILLRATRRRRELAVRVALGASRLQLYSLLTFENMWLALASGCLAVVGAQLGTLALNGLLVSGNASAGFTLSFRAFLFALAASLLVGTIVTVVQLGAVSRADFGTSLRTSAISAPVTRSPMRNALVCVQVALAMLLAVGAGLFTRSLRNVRTTDLGFTPTNVLIANLDFAGITARMNDSTPPDVLFGKLLNAVRQVPGVAVAAVTSAVPFQPSSVDAITVPGRDPRDFPKLPVFFVVATQDYLRAIDGRIAEGRWFEAADYGNGSMNIVVNQTLARTYWPGQSPLGRCVHIETQPECRTVVGVVVDTRQTSMEEEHRSQLFVPEMTDAHLSARLPHTLVMRSDRGLSIAGAVKSAIQSASPSLPYVTVRSLDDVIAPKVRPWRLGSTVFALFGGLALALAGFGLYSTISYAVSERTHEFGVRMALGADGSNIGRLVLRQVASLTGTGIASGAIIAAVLSPRIAPLLFKTAPRDELTFAAAACALLIASALACLAPVIRAMRSDPMTALRAE